MIAENHSKYDTSSMIADYLSVGAYCFDASEVLAKYDVDTIMGKDERGDEVLAFAAAVSADIQKTFFSDVETIMKFDFINKNSYGNIEKWHSDAEFIFPGQNATINLFFDDTSPEVGGRFDIAPYRCDLMGGKEHDELMHSFFPKKNHIIIFNQNRTWLHKVIPSTADRRMVSFAAQFPHFNHVQPHFL